MKANDAILAEEKHLTLYEELINNRQAKLLAGGAAQNTARGAQYILPPKTVLYIGAVGKDKYADILRAACDKAGRRTEYLTVDTVPTGRCGVIITGHDRSMCTSLAAANEYKLEHLKSPEIWKLVEAAQVYYVGGYHLTVCVPAALALAEETGDAPESVTTADNSTSTYNFHIHGAHDGHHVARTVASYLGHSGGSMVDRDAFA